MRSTILAILTIAFVAAIAVAASLRADNSNIDHNVKTTTPSKTVAGKIIFGCVALIIQI